MVAPPLTITVTKTTINTEVSIIWRGTDTVLRMAKAKATAPRKPNITDKTKWWTTSKSLKIPHSSQKNPYHQNLLQQTFILKFFHWMLVFNNRFSLWWRTLHTSYVRVAYRGIPYESLVYQENKSDEWHIPRLYRERGLHNYSIPCHRKYSDQMGRLGVIQLNCSDRWEGSEEYWRMWNGFPAFWLAVFSVAWYKRECHWNGFTSLHF